MTPQACQLCCPQRVSASIRAGGRSTVKCTAACRGLEVKMNIQDLRAKRQTITYGKTMGPGAE